MQAEYKSSPLAHKSGCKNLIIRTMNKPSSTDLPSTNVTSQAGPVRNVSLCRRVSEYDPTQLRRAPQVLLPSKKRGHRVSSELISGTAGSGSSDSEAASADPGALRSSPEPGKVPTVVVLYVLLWFDLISPS